jgi:hypothetical protein
MFWAHSIGLTPPHFIEVPVPSQKREQPCICALVVLIFPLSTIWNCSDGVFIFDFHYTL